MKTTEIFDKKMVLSFEVLPPKLDAPIDTIYKTLDGKGDFKYAGELIEFIREYGGFNILAVLHQVPIVHIQADIYCQCVQCTLGAGSSPQSIFRHVTVKP